MCFGWLPMASDCVLLMASDGFRLCFGWLPMTCNAIVSDAALLTARRLLYCFVKVAVWLAIWLILLSFALGATFSFIKGGLGEAIAVAELSNATGSDFPPDLVQMGSAVLAPVDEEYKEHMISAGVLFSILFLIAAILVCCGRQAIDRCVVLIEQASLALGSTPGLAIMPAIVSMLQLGVVLLCAFTLTVVPTMTMEGTLEGRLHETTGDKALEDWGLWSIALYIGFGAIWTYGDSR